MGSPILVDEGREQETGASEPQQISSLGGGTWQGEVTECPLKLNKCAP